MSIADKITSITGHLQKDYQSIANLGADLTNVDKNIENIAELLDGVYDRLPKTEFEEGESVTLENTLKGKLDFDNGVVGIGQTEQDSTNGYNLVDISSGTTSSLVGVSTSISGDIVTINGSRTDGSTSNAVRIINEINKFNISSSDTYKMTLNVISGTYTGRVGLTFLNSSGTTLAYIETATDGTTASKSLTFSEQISKISFFFNGDFSANNFKFQIMLQKGTSNINYEKYTGGQASPNPSYPQTINSVTGNQDVVVSGKNLLDISKFENNYTLDGNGLPVYNGSQIRLTNTTPIIVEGLEKVTLTYTGWGDGRSFIYSLLKADNTLISRVASNLSGTTITIGQAKYLYICFYDGATLSNITDAMLVEGSTGATYEPYITPKSYQLSLGDIELNAIGNYKDELIYDVENDKVYKNEKIGKVVLNGSENYTESSYQPTSNLKFYLMQNIPDAKYFDGTSYVVGSALNNYLKDFDQNEYTGGTKEGFLIARNGMNFCISNMTLQEFKTKLQQNNMEICYITNATKEIPITDTTLINQVKALYNAHSNNGTTIITSNGNLPMIIKVRGLKGE